MIAYGNHHALSASALEFHMRSELIPESDYPTDNNNQVLFIDDTYYYRITISIKITATDQVSSGGFRSYFDNSHFSVFMDPDDSIKPYVQTTDLFNDFAISAYSIVPDEGYISCGFMSTENLSEGGDLFSFYAKANSKSEIDNNPSIGDNVARGIEIHQIVNAQSDPLPPSDLIAAEPTYVEALYYNYVVGSIAYANGSQPIGLLDAQRLQALVNTYGTLSVDSVLTQNQANAIGCPGLIIDTTDFNTIVALRVADVDGDGDVDQDDADELLEYYVNVVLLSMNPPSGNRIGMTDGVYHIIQIP